MTCPWCNTETTTLATAYELGGKPVRVCPSCADRNAAGWRALWVHTRADRRHLLPECARPTQRRLEL